MNNRHLTADILDAYLEQELDAPARVQAAEHLARCALCRRRLAREEELNRALHALPRREPSPELAARIGRAAETRVLQERRRSRMPFIGAAAFFSILLLVWFGVQLALAFEENATFDLLSVLTTRPDLFSAYSTDAIWAVIEALPLGEIVLTLFALFTAIVLVGQWLETVRPPASLGEYTRVR
jgi:predicted anti-sigma-YlaC factor YlaD